MSNLKLTREFNSIVKNKKGGLLLLSKTRYAYHCNNKPRLIYKGKVRKTYQKIIKKIDNNIVIESYFEMLPQILTNPTLKKYIDVFSYLKYLGIAYSIESEEKKFNPFSEEIPQKLSERKNTCIIVIQLNEEQEAKLNKLKALCD